ncbi:MAG: ATP-binding domain-containing protein, partial [Lentisphaeria bacterium]|nr:ATP-binding domain-containing protein [Lentisphaeria bacterium]
RPQLLHSEPVEKEKLQEFIKGCMFSREDFGGWLTPDGTPWFKEEHLNDAWERFETLRILSPVHTGTCGVRNLNHHVCEILDFPEGNISCGMVFLILKNTAQLQIFNGDTGMVWYGKSLTEPATLSEGKAEHLPLYVFFPKTDINGERVWHGVQPGLLPEHDDAYAISVHKSQGSGYNRILFFLPEMQSEHKKSLLTKELLYTGITRAKKQTELVCTEEVFKETAVRETLRGNALIETFEIMQK